MNRDEGLEIRVYDRTWPDQFAELAARVNTALGGIVSRIEHIGSTAVPGLGYSKRSNKK
jgi:dephospho-CoA kinase